MDDEHDRASGQYEPGDRFSLVMPFVAVASAGGPFDDEAFAAGWECGRVDVLLSFAPRSAPLEMPICRSALAAQFDLIAMHRGFTVVVMPSEELPEWASATFTPTSR